MHVDMPITIRYAETDMMGVVHHASYLLYFEDARSRYLEALGCPYGELEDDGLVSPVLDIAVRYHEPLRYGNKAIVRTRLSAVTKMKATFSYEVYSHPSAMERGERPCCTGESVHCLVDASDFKPVNMAKRAPELYKRYCDALAE